MCVLKFDKISNWTATDPDTHLSFSDTALHVSMHTLQVCTYIAVWCTAMHDNKLTYSLTAYYTTTALLPKMHHVTGKKLASCTTRCSVFSFYLVC